MPTHSEFFDTKCSSQLRLHQNVWLPDGEAKSAMILVHGLIEHSGRYGDVAAELNRHGCAVYGLDLRGHGRSGGRRICIRRFDEYLDDVEQMTDRVRRRHPGSPVFLFGHSMGGAIVAKLCVQRKIDVRGVILSAAALTIGDGVYPVLRHLAMAAGWLLPWVRIAKMTGSNLSRDEQVVLEFRDDPLVYHGRLPNRTAAEILRAAGWLMGRLERVSQPFLVLHGTGDRVTHWEGSRQLHDRSQSADKSIRLYDGLYHDLLHEPEKSQVVSDLAEWIGARQASTVT
jgi:alpha-beta hydrolase superfamily lysophospholipase